MAKLLFGSYRQVTHTAEEWLLLNSILLNGQIGYESDTGLFKFGDGSSKWSDLSYSAVDWSRVKNQPNGFPPAQHGHSSSDISSLKGFNLSQDINLPLLEDDSLNTALSKIINTVNTKVGVGDSTLTDFLNSWKEDLYAGSITDITLAGTKLIITYGNGQKVEFITQDTIYELPVATADTLGGIFIGTNLTSIDGILSLSKENVVDALGFIPSNANYGPATDTEPGLLSPELKRKLDGIEDGAQVNTVFGVKGSSEVTFRVGNISISKENIGLGDVDNTADAVKRVASAKKLTSPINMSVSGAASSDVSVFDGSSDISLNITQLDATKLKGLIPIESVPKSALERLYPVVDDDARFSLTKDDVQNGDVVKVQSTGYIYFVVDDTKLSSEAGYQTFKVGSASSVEWTGVLNKPPTYPASPHTHYISDLKDLSVVGQTGSYNDLLDQPNSLPNPHPLSLSFISGKSIDYNGVLDVSSTITYTDVGAAPAVHKHTLADIVDGGTWGDSPSLSSDKNLSLVSCFDGISRDNLTFQSSVDGVIWSSFEDPLECQYLFIDSVLDNIKIFPGSFTKFRVIISAYVGINLALKKLILVPRASLADDIKLDVSLLNYNGEEVGLINDHQISGDFIYNIINFDQFQFSGVAPSSTSERQKTFKQITITLSYNGTENKKNVMLQSIKVLGDQIVSLPVSMPFVGIPISEIDYDLNTKFIGSVEALSLLSSTPTTLTTDSSFDSPNPHLDFLTFDAKASLIFSKSTGVGNNLTLKSNEKTSFISDSFVGELTGNASSANSLSTARTLDLGGSESLITGTALFDGSGDIQFNAKPQAMLLQVASTNNLPFYRISSLDFELNLMAFSSAWAFLATSDSVGGFFGLFKVGLTKQGDEISSSVECFLDSGSQATDRLQIGIYKDSLASRIHVDIFFKLSKPFESMKLYSLSNSFLNSFSSAFKFNSPYQEEGASSTDYRNSVDVYSSLDEAASKLYNSSYTKITSCNYVGSGTGAQISTITEEDIVSVMEGNSI